MWAEIPVPTTRFAYAAMPVIIGCLLMDLLDLWVR
jgi:hypothetical protein